MSRKKSTFNLLHNEMTKLEKSKPSNPTKISSSSSSSNTEKEKSKSRKSEREEHGLPKDPNIPDRSYGDFYCRVCDSHMNSPEIWDAHVSGKRHVKNWKKGNIDTQYEILSEESTLKDALENVTEPIVGLDYIHEIRKKERGIPPIYRCFLCCNNLFVIPGVIEHCLSLKHRLSYLKEKNPDQHQLLTDTNLKRNHMEPLVFEECMKMEKKFGRGKVIVKQEKAKKSSPVRTRPLLSDDSDNDQKSAQHDYMWREVGPYRHSETKRGKNRDKNDFSSDDELAEVYAESTSRKRSVSPTRKDQRSYRKRFESDLYEKDSKYRSLENDSRYKQYDRSSPREQKKSLTPEYERRDYNRSRSPLKEVYGRSSASRKKSNNEIKDISDESSITNELCQYLNLPKEKLFVLLLMKIKVETPVDIKFLSQVIVMLQSVLHNQNMTSNLKEEYTKIFGTPSDTSSVARRNFSDSTFANQKLERSKNLKSSSNYNNPSSQQQSMSHQPSSHNVPSIQYTSSAQAHQYAASYPSSYNNTVALYQNASYPYSPFSNTPAPYGNHNSQSNLPPMIPGLTLSENERQNIPSYNNYPNTYAKM